MTPSPRWSMAKALLCLTLSLPCVSRIRRVLCSHLRTLWMALMMLTVICVLLQILGIFLHSRSDKLVSEELLNTKISAESRRAPSTLLYDRDGLGVLPALSLKGNRATEGTKSQIGVHVTAKRKGKRLGHLKFSTDFLSRHPDKTLYFHIDSHVESRKISAGQLVVPAKEPVSERSSDGTLYKVPDLRTVVQSLPAANDSRNKKTFTAPRSSQIQLNSAHDNKGACRPKNHIVFLKTHKTASSTILNILYRYGDSRNLTFALPLKKHPQLYYPYFFESYFVEGSSSMKEFHIMCNHMRFRKAEVRKVMPADSFYFSILRNPVSMFESIFIYYKTSPAFHKALNLDYFLDIGWRDYNKSLLNNHYAHNLLAFDFGFDNDIAANGEYLEERARAAIAAIEQDFHLILISEYFDESMILLKKALCWTLDDIVSFKLNSRNEKTRRKLLPLTEEKIKAWNALDWRLYVHFNMTFWKKVDTLVGREEMRKEVSRLQDRRGQLSETCLSDGAAVDPSHIIDAGLRPFQYGAAIIQGYNLNPSLDGLTKTQCRNLITPELQYTDYLYTKQFPALAKKHGKATKAVPGKAALNQTAVTKHILRKRSTRHKDMNMNKQSPASAHLPLAVPENNTNIP